MKPGRAGTMTHDYKRNGTTTLFAALDVLTGSVIGQCLPRHRHSRVFDVPASTIDRQVPKGLQIHLILDNYATHNHPNVKAWLAKHPRFHLHFTPTSSSWVNMIEGFFAQAHQQGDPSRCVRLSPGADRGNRCLPRGQQHQPDAVHLDQDR